ncbi:retrovirus-related pol polyprotein from transposon TNT 1-94 [Tanacetum coccineum]
MMGPGSSVNLEVQKEGITEEQPNTTCSLESNVTPSGISQVNTRGDTSQSITTQSSSSSSGSLEEDTESEGLQLRRSKRGNVPKRHFEVEGKSFDFAMFAGDPANAESTTTTITFDVKSAFLNGELKEEVYVQQPELFEVLGDEHKAYKLEKALYGLKQASRAWYSKIDEFFHLNGFERSPNEPTLYVKREGAEDIMFVSLVKQTKNGIFVSQEKYARDILKQFNMEGRNTEETPMNVHEKLVIDDDLAYAVGLVSRFMHCPSKQHYGAAKRILSDWAGAKDDMKSTSGNCFMFGSGVVTWASKKQATIALSSTEAEYISAATAACQAVWLMRVLEDLNQTQERAGFIFCNNRSAVAEN